MFSIPLHRFRPSFVSPTLYPISRHTRLKSRRYFPILSSQRRFRMHSPSHRCVNISHDAIAESLVTEDIVVGELPKCSAHWVTRDVLAWRKQLTDSKGVHYRFKLNSSYEGKLKATKDGIQNIDYESRLYVLNRKEQYTKLSRYPHLFGCTLLQLEDPDLMDYPTLMKSQLWVSCETNEGHIVDITGVQLPGVLDDIFAYEGPLGFMYRPNGISRLRVWAPTSQWVEVMCWDTPRGGEPVVMAMQPAASGLWEVAISDEWLWKFYNFRVYVYCPWSQQFEVHEVTDPYSRGLAANGERSQFVDLNDPDIKPRNWDQHSIPDLKSFTDITVYELHVRDFSMSDPSVPADLRGKYLAFDPSCIESSTGGVSNGLRHLMELRDAGLTHIHLLPTYDFASVPEFEEEQLKLDVDLRRFRPDSEEQQKAVLSIADQDGFNWGYDPVHFGVPDGSYATTPDGEPRIIEFRQMVMALHRMGFRLVLDVVYNHTFEGQSGKYSVLDKIVPGYYHR